MRMSTVCLNLCIHQAASFNNLTITCSFGVPVICKPKISTGYICESFVLVGWYLEGKMQIALLTELKEGSERAHTLSGNSCDWLQLCFRFHCIHSSIGNLEVLYIENILAYCAGWQTYKVICKILWQWHQWWSPLLLVVIFLLFLLLGDFYSAAENGVCLVITLWIYIIGL